MVQIRVTFEPKTHEQSQVLNLALFFNAALLPSGAWHPRGDRRVEIRSWVAILGEGGFRLGPVGHHRR